MIYLFIESVIRWEGVDEKGHYLKHVFLGNQSAFNTFYKEEKITLFFSKKEYRLKRKQKKTQLVNTFTKDLANILATGLPLLNSLSLLQKKQHLSILSHLVTDLKKSILSGKSFSESLQRYQHLFSKNYIQLVYAAEKINQLPVILKQLSVQQDFTEQLKNKLKKALIYPVSVLLFTFMITLGLMTFAIPQFQSLFNNFNAKLPLATQIIILITNYLKKYFFLLLISSIIAPLFFIYTYRLSYRFKRHMQNLLLALPFVGTLYRLKLVAHWTTILALTLKSGIRLQEGLILANNTLTHLRLKESCDTLIPGVMSGYTLHQALARITFFEQSERYLVEMGETTATLPLLLERISNESLYIIGQKLEFLSKWIEPAIMLVLAFIAGGLIITMYLPIFKIGTLL